MKRPIKVLLADDDPVLRKLIPHQLSAADFEVSTAATGEDALMAISEDDFDVVLLDVNLPEVSGLEILSAIRQTDEGPEAIMLTADNSLTTGLEAMRRGAYEYLTKPASPDQIEVVVRKAFEKHRLIKQNSQLRAAVRSQNKNFATEPVHKSRAMKEIFSQSEIVAATDSTLLITGESGTGKDVLARWIHALSDRGDLPFVSVNCGALPENLFESEFFGHEKGAFTGAAAPKAGLVESADGSTLFLDEIGEMPLAMQVKLLHLLESSMYRRVGATKDRKADIRIIAATNRPLEEDVRGGKFRADLYYRLNVISFHIPALRERPEDIPELVDFFMAKLRHRFNRPLLSLSEKAKKQLAASKWPGNVRELRNTLERTIVLTQGNVIETISGLDSEGTVPNIIEIEPAASLESLAQLEKRHIKKVLAQVGGKREKAASILGITERTLYRKLKEFNLES